MIHRTDRTYSVHARLVSLGGGILLGVLLAFAALLFEVYTSPTSMRVQQLLVSAIGVGLIVYLVDSASETLKWHAPTIIFNSWLKRRRRISLLGRESIQLVHEGLNLEHGIESLVVCGHEGEQAQRFSLGPLWRRRDLEAFLQEVR